MTAAAKPDDIARVVRLTYNGRECGIETVEIGPFKAGEIPRIVTRGPLPKDWDQGPPAGERVVRWDTDEGHRYFVEQAVIDDQNGGEVLKVVVLDRQTGKRWEFNR